MNERPHITVALFTYCPEKGHQREEYAKATIRGLIQNLDYDGPALSWHIADDGSYPGYVDGLISMGSSIFPFNPSVSNSRHRGYGASWNAMTAAVHPLAGGHDSNLVLCIEDDWVLTNPLDLTPLAEAIVESQGELRCVRLGYLGWTNPLFGTLRYWGSVFLLLSPDSPEKHVFSGGPRLETVAFERTQGLWPELMAAGYTELEVAGRTQSRIGVGWPLDIGLNADGGNPSKFVHIGSISVKDNPL